MSQIGKSNRDRKYLSGCPGLDGQGENWEVMAKEYRLSFWGDETVLKLRVMIAALKTIDNTKNHLNILNM